MTAYSTASQNFKVSFNEELVSGGNKRICLQSLSIQNITDMLSSNHHFSLYTKLKSSTNDWFPLDRNGIVKSKHVLAPCTKVCKNL